MPRIEILIDGSTAFEKDDFSQLQLEIGRGNATLRVDFDPDRQNSIEGFTGDDIALSNLSSAVEESARILHQSGAPQ